MKSPLAICRSVGPECNDWLHHLKVILISFCLDLSKLVFGAEFSWSQLDTNLLDDSTTNRPCADNDDSDYLAIEAAWLPTAATASNDPSFVPRVLWCAIFTCAESIVSQPFAPHTTLPHRRRKRLGSPSDSVISPAAAGATRRRSLGPPPAGLLCLRRPYK